jgi:hypothetical protein
MFEPIKLKWDGRDVIIPPERVLGAIATVEEHLTLLDIAHLSRSPKPGKVAMAFAALLRYAGIEVEDDLVYSAMCDPDLANPGEITGSISTIILMMIPPNVKKKETLIPAKRKPRQRRKS